MAEIRKHGGKIDEVIAQDVGFHMEYMDDGRIWIGLTNKDGTVDHLNLYTRRGSEILSDFEPNQ